MVGVAVVVFFSVIATTVKSLQVGPVSALRADHAVTPLGAPAGKVPGTLSAELGSVPGVEDLATVHATVGLLVDGGADPGTTPTVVPVGMIEAGDLDATYDLQGTDDDGSPLDAAHLEAGEVMVASSELTEHPLGSDLAVRGAAGTARGTVVGSFATSLPGFASPQVLFDRDTYMAAFDDPGAAAIFMVTDGRQSTIQALESVANGAGRFQTAAEYAEASTSPVDTILDLIYALLAIAVVIALVGLANTMALSLRERTTEIGVARAIGTTRLQVVLSVLLEASVTAVLGAGLGLAVGIGVAFPTVALLDMAALPSPVIPVSDLLVVAFLAIGGGVIASVAPAVSLSRRPPLDAIAAVG